MDIGIKHKGHISPDFMSYRLCLKREQFCLFGYLLDSVEGLANHHSTDETGEMDISVPAARIAEFEQFLDAWRSFDEPSRQENTALWLTEKSKG
ncbi:MAG: hypothetical protein U1B83_05915 [Candidatus Cloacimonadaceae bacterium]|nr:hypothetical protein [Candidatus Cloacimonadaceae bacterium]